MLVRGSSTRNRPGENDQRSLVAAIVTNTAVTNPMPSCNVLGRVSIGDSQKATVSNET